MITNFINPLRTLRATSLLVFLNFVLLFGCKKVVDTQPAEVVGKAVGKTEIITTPMLKNGLLHFANFKSFAAYNGKFTKTPVTTNASSLIGPGSPDFISMQNAFDQITEDERQIGESLEQQYPNGPASVYDNTHSGLLQSYPKAYYQAGNSTDGYYYELNCFDRAAATRINAEGFVKVADDILQYTKDYYKIWLNGDEESLQVLDNTLESDGDIVVVAVNNQNSIAKAQQDTRLIRLLLEKSSQSCQNTKIRRRVIGYLDFIQYVTIEMNSLPPFSSHISFFETQYKATSRSLQRRLLGFWYDNWNTGHQQEGDIVATDNINSYGFDANGNQVNFIADWGTNYNLIKNNASKFEVDIPLLWGYGMNFDYSRYVFSNLKPEIYSANHSFLAAAPTNTPACSCTKLLM